MTAPPVAEDQPGLTTEYLVPDWVRVRREDFGLLFYDTRSTRLTFVRSGDSLAPPPFIGPRRVLRVRPLDEGRRPAVSRLLRNLVAKGLIVAVAPD
ncbi:MAG: mycofactocin biosynthesis chaperone MftB [bacterium]